MRRSVLAAALLVILAAGLGAQDERPAVAVVDFENRSQNGGPELGTMCAEVLSDLLVQTRRFRVFDRERVDSIIQEQSFQQMSGFVDPGEAVRFGRMIGVRYLVSGAILRTGVEAREFSGYGVTTRTEEWQARVRVQVIDVQSGETFFSQTGEARQVQQGPSTHGGTFNSMIFEQLLEEALPPLVGDFCGVIEEAATTAVATPTTPVSERVTVSVTSTPPGADIEVDGLFVGNTPADVALDPGIHMVRLALTDHVPWERQMQVVPGTAVSATLRPLERIETATPPVGIVAETPPTGVLQTGLRGETDEPTTQETTTDDLFEK